MVVCKEWINMITIDNVTVKAIEEMLPIDKSQLDEELAMQSYIQSVISRKVVALISLREKLRDEEEIISERIKNEIITKEPNLGVQKIEVRAKIHPERVAMLHQLRDARRDVDLWSALRDSWVGRGYSLNALCDLYVSDYFTKDSHTIKTSIKTTSSDYERPVRPKHVANISQIKKRVKVE